MVCRDVEARYVEAEEGRWIATPELLAARCDENTIGEGRRACFTLLCFLFPRRCAPCVHAAGASVEAPLARGPSR